MKYYVYDHKKKMVVDILPMPYTKTLIVPAYNNIYMIVITNVDLLCVLGGREFLDELARESRQIF